MLIVGFKGIGKTILSQKYPDKVIELNIDNASSITNDILINFIEKIRENLTKYEIVIISYIEEVVLCLDTLGIDYTIVYPTQMDLDRISSYMDLYNIFKGLAIKKNSIVLDIGENLEQKLSNKYSWIDINANINNVIIEQQEIIKKSKKSKKSKKYHKDMIVKETDNVETTILPEPISKKELTLQDLIEQDTDITEADVREMKSITNKFKVAMILQAKSRLNTVLKLCNILDKLYDELIDRVDKSLGTTDTASLMYTTDYIAKALNETNQFIMSLITNEKIQNFFIIENSNIINISDNRVDIDKREKIRKAAEIVLDNADYFSNGQFDKVINPNVVFENDNNGGDDNANSTT